MKSRDKFIRFILYDFYYDWLGELDTDQSFDEYLYCHADLLGEKFLRELKRTYGSCRMAVDEVWK